jgi:hypothetical protein
VVWQSLGADPRLIPASAAAECLVQQRRPPHLVWNPVSGDIVQLIPVVRAACSIGGPEGLYDSGGVAAPAHDPANRQGRLCVQIGVVAWAWEPFTDGVMNGAGALLGWLASWGVPSRWPAGQPAPCRLARTGERSRAHWALGGHFGASQVPGWNAAGPGAIDIELLSMPSAVPCPAISGASLSRPARPAHPGRSEALNHARRVALTDMLGPEIDAGATPATAGHLAGQRA